MQAGPALRLHRLLLLLVVVQRVLGEEGRRQAQGPVWQCGQEAQDRVMSGAMHFMQGCTRTRHQQLRIGR